MTKIETLYTGKSVKEILHELSGKELINEFGSYLSKIVVVGVKIEGDVLGRARYLDERTTNIVLEMIDLLGKEYPKEIISLLSEQEYTLLTNISEKYNLFKYVIEHMTTVQEIINKKVYILISSLLDYNAKDIYGKKVYVSYGNRGNTYKGFVNDLYSNESVKNGVFGVDFKLEIEVYVYNLIELGRKLGVNEEILSLLEEINEKTEYMKLPKHRNNSTAIPPSLRQWQPVDTKYEIEFKVALYQYAKELNKVISKEYPNYEVKTSEFFQTRTDVDTEFYITVEKRVEFHDDYELLRSELINTIGTFNKIENHYFGFDYMHNDLVKNRKEYSEQNQPLFSI